MSKLISALIAAGLGLGLSTAGAQNVESDKDKAQGQEQVMQQKETGAVQSGQSAKAMPGYNEVGERQVGLEQYRVEQEHCGAMSGGARSDCMHLAKVRYEGWAIMQCELVSGASRTRCYQNIQSATMSDRAAGAPETGAVRRNEEEEKPGRQ